jgi:hypothetical protein
MSSVSTSQNRLCVRDVIRWHLLSTEGAAFVDSAMP